MRTDFDYQDLDADVADRRSMKRKLTVAGGILVLFALVATTAAVTDKNRMVGVSVEKREAMKTGVTEQDDVLRVDSDFLANVRERDQVFVKDDWSSDGEESYIHVVGKPVSADYSVLQPFPLAGRIRFCKSAILYLMHLPSAHVVEKTVQMRNGMTSYNGKKVFVIIISPPNRFYHGRYVSGTQMLYRNIQMLCSGVPAPPIGGPNTPPPSYTSTRFFPYPGTSTTRYFGGHTTTGNYGPGPGYTTRNPYQSTGVLPRYTTPYPPPSSTGYFGGYTTTGYYGPRYTTRSPYQNTGFPPRSTTGYIPGPPMGGTTQSGGNFGSSFYTQSPTMSMNPSTYPSRSPTASPV